MGPLRRLVVQQMNTMRRASRILIVFGFLFLILSPSVSQAQRNSLTIFGPPAINLNPVFSSSGQTVATDSDDSSTLVWDNPRSKSKITVQTFSPGQRYTLFIEARNATNGHSKGRIELRDGMKSTDLISNVKKKKDGSATLLYEAEAHIDEGSTSIDPTDIHTVTFTLTEQ